MTYTLQGNAILDFFSTTVIHRDTTLPGQAQVLDMNASTRQGVSDSIAADKTASEKRQQDFMKMIQSSGFIVAGATALVVILSLAKKKKK